MVLHLTYNGTTYVLEYTRKSIQTMERNGFQVDKLNTMPMTMLPDLFAGSFLANHKFTKRTLIDEIFDQIPNRPELLGKLSEMYVETFTTLLNGNTEGESQGKVTWVEA